MIGEFIKTIKYREFAYKNNSNFYRHLKFNLKSLKKFINIQKKDVFVSNAYYDKDNRWIGCDLFFDIDIDNIKYPKLIVMLLNDKLNLNKFEIIFSGNGYHVVCYDESIRYLNSCERRMIAEYVRDKICNIDMVCTIDINRLRRIPTTINSKNNKVCIIKYSWRD